MSYAHRHCDDEHHWRFDAPVSNASSILFLIGKTITDFQGNSDGTLVLKFDNGDVLTFYDETQEYQAYRICHGDDPPIVV